MTLAAKLYLVRGNDRRRSDRVRAGARSTLREAENAPREVVVRDISLHGFRCSGGEHVAVGAEVVLGLDGRGSAAAIVRWCDGDNIGCEFIRPLTQRDLAGAFRGGVVISGAFASPTARE